MCCCTIAILYVIGRSSTAEMVGDGHHMKRSPPTPPPTSLSSLFLLSCRLGHPDIFGLIRKHELYEASLRHLKELLQLDQMVEHTQLEGCVWMTVDRVQLHCTPCCGTPCCGTPCCGTPCCGTPCCGTSCRRWLIIYVYAVSVRGIKHSYFTCVGLLARRAIILGTQSYIIARGATILGTQSYSSPKGVIVQPKLL